MTPNGSDVTWEWLGTAGHFIAASSCCFRLHTRVGDYRVSTVGCYHPRGELNDPHEIGAGRLYETMVFKLDADGEPREWLEIDADGYNDQASAQNGHVAMCEKWAGQCRREQP